ncbi:MAG: hypothetical protein M9900_11810 [Flavobacteriales bacterium]|nr:hypothetical protein [Flavobacteriales bacterium]
MSQQDLFGQTISPPSESTSLTVKKKDKELLSKGQTTFNRLIKKVEKLRKEIDGLHKAAGNKGHWFHGTRIMQ